MPNKKNNKSEPIVSLESEETVNIREINTSDDDGAETKTKFKSSKHATGLQVPIEVPPVAQSGFDLLESEVSALRAKVSDLERKIADIDEMMVKLPHTSSAPADPISISDILERRFDELKTQERIWVNQQILIKLQQSRR